MLKLLFLTILLLITGCSSNCKYKTKINSFTSLIHYDPTSQKAEYKLYQTGIPFLVEEYLKTGQINKDPKYSCFTGKEAFASVNYFRVLDYQRPLMRDYILGKTENIKFIKEEKIKNNKYGYLYKEEIQRNIQIKTKECLVELDGTKRVVVSEIYK